MHSYLKPIAACQTKAKSKKNTGITGNTSTIGLNTTYASGKRDNIKVSIIILIGYKFSKINNYILITIHYIVKIS